MTCTCDLCKKTNLAAHEIFVAAGPGPQSFGYCASCLQLGIYPIEGWIDYLYLIWPNISPEVREEVEKSLKYANKTWEWFEQETLDACAKLDNYFDEMGKAQAGNPEL